MKKLFSVLLTLAMLFALVACSNSSNPAGNTANEGGNSNSSGETESDTPAYHIGIVTGTDSQ